MLFLRRFCLLLALCFSINFLGVFAEVDDIELSLTPDFANTELNIKGARLIEAYLTKYVGQLTEFKDLHEISSDPIIDNAIANIKKMIFNLRKIQTDKVEKEVAERAMSQTISEIKNLNKSLKIYLKNKASQIKEEARMTQENILKVVSPFQKKLEKVIASLKQNTANLHDTTNKKRISSYLNELESENIKLKTFKKLSFKNKREVKDYIIGAITHIGKLIDGIKESL